MSGDYADRAEEFRALLGIAPGASPVELKEAYRDLAKVWHPDRFAHDPRLQRKAQEKLKEINRAYEFLSSGRPARRPSPAPPPEWARAAARDPGRHSGRRYLLILTLVSGVTLLIVSSALVNRGGPSVTNQSPPPTLASQTVAEDAPPAPPPSSQKSEAVPAAVRSAPRPRALTEAGADRARPSGLDATPARPAPTVTLTIDSVTGLIANRHCPNKVSMTYALGREPHRHCDLKHRTEVAPLK